MCVREKVIKDSDKYTHVTEPTPGTYICPRWLSVKNVFNECRHALEIHFSDRNWGRRDQSATDCVVSNKRLPRPRFLQVRFVSLVRRECIETVQSKALGLRSGGDRIHDNLRIPS